MYKRKGMYFQNNTPSIKSYDMKKKSKWKYCHITACDPLPDEHKQWPWLGELYVLQDQSWTGFLGANFLLFAILKKETVHHLWMNMSSGGLCSGERSWSYIEQTLMTKTGRFPVLPNWEVADMALLTYLPVIVEWSSAVMESRSWPTYKEQARMVIVDIFIHFYTCGMEAGRADFCALKEWWFLYADKWQWWGVCSQAW